MSNPASRGTVVVTRPAGQARELLDRLRAARFAAVHIPAFDIVPTLPDLAALGPLDAYDLVHFASANAIERFFERLPNARFAPDAWLAVMGPTSRATLHAHTRHSQVVTPGHEHAGPETPLDSETLIASLRTLKPHAFRRALCVKGEGGRTVLADALRERGTQVRELVMYRRLRPRLSPQQAMQLSDALDSGWCCSVLTSSEGAVNFAAMIEGALQPRVFAMPAVVTHPRVASAATGCGWNRIQFSPPGDDALVLTLESAAPRP